MSQGGFPFLCCLEQFQKEQYQLLFVHLVEFGCEPVWTCTIFGWQAINCCLIFRPCYWFIQRFIFFLVQSWEGVSVQECIHFFQIYWFICIELVIVISNGSLYFCGIGGDILFIIFYFIYSILLSFLFFISLASGLSILLIFQKNQLLDSFMFLKGFLCLYLLQFSSDLSYFLSSARF